jgi:hypothetical protein
VQGLGLTNIVHCHHCAALHRPYRAHIPSVLAYNVDLLGMIASTNPTSLGTGLRTVGVNSPRRRRRNRFL